MALSRRRIIQIAGGMSFLWSARYSATAQAYPSRPIHWVVPYPPGGPADILARLIGQPLSESVGVPVVVDNRAGASGNLGTEAVVHASPDGYTLLLVTAANAVNVSLFPSLNFNFVRDIAPVIGLIRTPLVMEVNPTFPAKTVAEFIAFAKANPGKLNMASSGLGTPQHVSGELFKMMAGVEMTHVPFRGVAPALTALMGNQVQVMFDTTPGSIAHIKAGSLRPLAVTTSERAPALPNVPTISETLPGYEASGWYGVGTQREVPVEIVDKLNNQIGSILSESTIQDKLSGLGAVAIGGSSGEFKTLIEAETEEWRRVVQFAGLKPE
jgi:tripartite-type tricarboxylate transporter receptor subunit TctC